MGLGAEAESVESQTNGSGFLGCMDDRRDDGMEGEVTILVLVEDEVNDSTAGEGVFPDSLSDAGGEFWEEDEVAFKIRVGGFRGILEFGDVGHGCIRCCLGAVPLDWIC